MPFRCMSSIIEAAPSFPYDCLRNSRRILMKFPYFFYVFWWWLRHCSACLVPTNISMDLKILSILLRCLLRKWLKCISRNQWYLLCSSTLQCPLAFPLPKIFVPSLFLFAFLTALAFSFVSTLSNPIMPKSGSSVMFSLVLSIRSPKRSSHEGFR